MIADTSSRSPDVLEVIADLSSDEIFTPPRIVNRVLDLLPDEVWTDPTLRWLDPGCKTGVFLREITKRLMVGLEDAIPDRQERLEHILREQVFGIAITRLTAWMSRRTVYCSKDATADHIPAHLDHPDGHIWFRRIEHPYDRNGRCSECGASRGQMERDGKDNHAYGFIHEAGRAAIAEEFDMQFDVIISNPPYQMTSGGNSRSIPLYNLFVEHAKQLNPKHIVMIIPSRWMVTGLGLSTFRSTMLNDNRILELVDYPNAAEVFPSVDIKSGVCYFHWSRDQTGACKITTVRDGEQDGPVERALNEFDVLVRDSRALEILHKVLAHEEESVIDILSADKEFGLTSNFSQYTRQKTKDSVPLYAYASPGKPVGWVSRSRITKSADLLDTWKVLTPKAGPGNSGGHVLPDMVLGRPHIASNPSACTQTYLFFSVGSESEAESLASYLRTRFARFLVSLRKISQDATRATYEWVPRQPWDREWTDAELFNKYAITAEEQAYIESRIREMPA